MPAVMGKIGRTYPAPQRSAVATLKEKVAYRAYMGHLDLMPWISGPDISPYRKKQAWRDMFNHDAVKAPLLQKVYSVSSLDLQTTPASDNPRDQEIADFLKYQWTDAVQGEFPAVAEAILLPALLCKHSICEKVWWQDLWPRGRFRGKQFYRAVKAKEDATLKLDKFRNVVAVCGRDEDGKKVEWDPSDFIIFKNLSLFEDEGTADLQAVYDLVWKLDTIEKLHNIHLDKFTSPAIVGTISRDVQEVKDPDTGETVPIQGPLEENLAGMKSRNWMVVPEGVKVEALTLATRGEAEFLAKCDELRQRIALAIAGAYLQMMAQGNPGEMRGDSMAGKSTAELFVWALAAKLASVLNTQATPDLVAMNYAGADYAKISLGGINYQELGAAIVIDEAAQRMGFKHSNRAFSRKYGLQQAADPSDTLTAPVAAPPAFGFSEQPNKTLETALAEGANKQVAALQTLQEQISLINQAIQKISVQPPPPQIAKVFAEPRGKAVEAKLDRQHAHGGEVGLAGADGRKAAQLLEEAKSQGAAKLAELARTAVRRMLARDKPAKAKRLFDDAELEDLAAQIAATNATAELLGRARIREREQKVLDAKGELKKFSEAATTFHVFDEAGPLEPMAPARALEYFRSLVPKLGVNPERWGPALERQAFTLAVAADKIILGKVKDLIAEKLETGDGIGAAPEEIDALLDEAGIGERNAGYAENVFRTNMMDSYNTGAEQEGLDVADTFPVWRYANPDDGRSRKTHAAKNGNYYPNTADTSFTAVRGTEIEDVAQCRCTMIFVDKFEWEELRKAGARLAGGHGFAEDQGPILVRDVLDRIGETGAATASALADMARGLQAVADRPQPEIPQTVVQVPPIVVPPAVVKVVQQPAPAPAPRRVRKTQQVERDEDGQIKRTVTDEIEVEDDQ